MTEERRTLAELIAAERKAAERHAWWPDSGTSADRKAARAAVDERVKELDS